MTEERRDGLIAAWTVVSGLVGYACLAYAVLQSHGDRVEALVNRLLGGGV